MPVSPSRREVLAAGGGVLAGVAGGYLARPRLDAQQSATDLPDPVPLAWAPTEWPYPDYDPARTRNPPPVSAPDGDLSVVSRTPLDDASRWSPPLVANGRVVAASASQRGATVLSVDAASDDRAWHHRFLGETAGEAPRLLAPGDGVYYRISEFEEGPLGMFGAASGEHAWGVDDPPYGGWTVGAGRLYYGDRATGALHAYDARSGAELWTVSVDDERLVVESFHPDFGVFAGSMETLYALDPADGSVLWTQPVPTHVKSGPVVAGGRAFASKWGDGMDLLAFDTATGDEEWRYPLSPTEVAVEDGVARRWYEVEAATGDVVLAREMRADPSPARLHAVDAASGDRLWRIAPPEGTDGFSPPTVVDGEVFVCVGGDDLTELRRLDLADGSTTGTWTLPDHGRGPVVTDGRVLVQTDEALLAFD